MTATMRFVVWGALPVGSLLGGALGALIGRHTTLWVSAGLGALSGLPVVFSPLRKLREMPESAAASS